MIEVDPTNPKRDLLDPLEKRLYRKLSSVEGKDMLEPYNPNLRIDQLNAALKTQLSVVCMACHLDSGAYVYDQAAQAVTATEVRTKQQQTYGTIVDIQDQMIRPFIVEMIDNIRALQTLYGIEAIPEDILLGFDFGDSILVDEQSDRANAQAEVSVGLRSKLAYLMDYRGMTETEALAEIERIKAETPVVTGFFGA
jgi:A118 family predicted phage portal protein